MVRENKALDEDLAQARLELEEARRSTQRLIEAQRISGVGSYDFEIATNTNVWSDQLYRIYGREPQSFNASYEVFLSMLHPDDREHVMCTGSRMVRAWSAIARVSACRIHHVAYVENLKPFV